LPSILCKVTQRQSFGVFRLGQLIKCFGYLAGSFAYHMTPGAHQALFLLLLWRQALFFLRLIHSLILAPLATISPGKILDALGLEAGEDLAGPVGDLARKPGKARDVDAV
jgi:hypothetical protein